MFSDSFRFAQPRDIALTLALAIAAFGAHGGNARSVDHSLGLVQDHSRQLAAQDAAALSAREMAVAVGKLPDPTLKATIDKLPIQPPESIRFRFESLVKLLAFFVGAASVSVVQDVHGPWRPPRSRMPWIAWPAHTVMPHSLRRRMGSTGIAMKAKRRRGGFTPRSGQMQEERATRGRRLHIAHC